MLNVKNDRLDATLIIIIFWAEYRGLLPDPAGPEILSGFGSGFGLMFNE